MTPDNLLSLYREAEKAKLELLRAFGVHDEYDPFEAAEGIREMRAELVRVTRENARLRRDGR